MRVPALVAAGALSVLVSCDHSPAAIDPLQDPALAVGQGIPLNATAGFGRDDVGSPFPSPTGHDRSGHAIDKVRPHVVQIRAGGTVTFQMGTFHQVAIYDEGVQPQDIDITDTVDLTAPPPAPLGTVIIPDFLIDDSANRLAVGPFSFAPMSWTSPPDTRDVPGDLRGRAALRVREHVRLGGGEIVGAADVATDQGRAPRGNMAPVLFSERGADAE